MKSGCSSIILSLGTNIGDKKANIFDAISKLRENNIEIVAASPLYLTKPVGYFHQDDFFNIALDIKTELNPNSLLDLTQKIEKEMGREKNFRWGPRKIDIDILIYNDIILKSKKLSIPHKEIANRYFIVKMIEDIKPELIIPGVNISVSDLVKGLKKDGEIKEIMSNIIK